MPAIRIAESPDDGVMMAVPFLGLDGFEFLGPEEEAVARLALQAQVLPGIVVDRDGEVDLVLEILLDGRDRRRLPFSAMSKMSASPSGQIRTRSPRRNSTPATRMRSSGGASSQGFAGFIRNLVSSALYG